LYPVSLSGNFARKIEDSEVLQKKQTENGSPADFPYSVLPFAHRANGILLLVRLLTKKQREVIRFQTD
jgi:hypothetical protein